MNPTLPPWAQRLVRRTAKGRQGCEGKAAYGSELHARVAGRNLLRSGVAQQGVDRMWPYACINCRRWHLSKTARNETPISADVTHEGVPPSDHDRRPRRVALEVRL